jgi:hypothetical protein
MSRKPRIRIINHRAGDESELNMPWEKRQVICDALSHIQRASRSVPGSIVTANQVATIKRSLENLSKEIKAALELLD